MILGPDRPKLCAVIVSYKSPEAVASCINSILDIIDVVFVIDNSSDPEVRKVLGSFSDDKVSVIFNETNEGLAAALNRGLQFSLERGYRWTLLLDQDSRASEQMINEMMSSFSNLATEEREKTAMIVPAVYDRNFKKMLPSVVTTNFLNRKIYAPESDMFVHLHITSGTLLRNEVLPLIGFMNEHFFIDYVDFEYCFRALDKGYKILMSRNAVLNHSLADRKRKFGCQFREHAPERVYYQTRNRLFTSLKYGKKYRSFFYAESCRSIGKLIKIVLLESDKREKLTMLFRGIRDVLRQYDELAGGSSCCFEKQADSPGGREISDV